MTLVVLLILAALWAVVLIPPLLRARTERADDTIGNFHHRLGVLSRTNHGARISLFDRARPRSAAKRRRDIVVGLAGAATVTLLGALATGQGAVWAVHLLTDALLVAYLAAWAWVRSVQAERAEKLLYLPVPPGRGLSGPGAAPVTDGEPEIDLREPALALRRTASS